MQSVSIPTSRDIYLEADGRRLAAVESYQALAARELYGVEALGSSAPVGMVSGPTSYRLELKRILFERAVDFHGLSGFNVVIVKPEGRVAYTGCEWERISEGVTAGEPCVEAITLSAKGRVLL